MLQIKEAEQVDGEEEEEDGGAAEGRVLFLETARA